MNHRRRILYEIGIVYALILACVSTATSADPSHTNSAPTIIETLVERENKIPTNAVKMSPANDMHPPVLYSGEFKNPVPIVGEINTAGAEDSPFITPDGNTLYFTFTPDVTVPVEEQLLDGVTGIYVSQKLNGSWSKPERVILQDRGKLALDGCEFVMSTIIWFCSAREGYTGIHWFNAEYRNGVWKNWKLALLNPDFKVGELHITNDGNEMYFGSDRPGGKGKMDIWVSKKFKEEWQEPRNILIINTKDDEGWPALNPKGDELWFYRNYGIWKSRKVNGEWQEAEQILSSLAGEPTVDNEGNLYFVHHFYKDDKMIEADIYVAYRKAA
jgi:hypothetical protein